MKRSRSLQIFLLGLCCLVSSAHAELSAEIKALLGDKVLSRGEVGVCIIRLADTQTQAKVIFESKSAIPRIPASNLKLITTAAALDKFGPEFQFHTTLAMRNNDIALIGDGDPTLGDAELLKKVGWNVDTVFKSWAESLLKRGIKQVDDVYVDDSIFDQMFVHPSWPAEQMQKRYQAQVGGINLNANCLDFFVRTTRPSEIVDFTTNPPTSYANISNTCITGTSNAVWLSRVLGGNQIVLRGQTDLSADVPASVTIHDPPMFAGTVLSETLQANGVRVKGKVLRDRTVRSSLSAHGPTSGPTAQWAPIAIHSTPITAVLARANKDSMNLYAESLCKRLGAATSGQSGSWENGTIAVAAMLQSIGISGDEYSLDDGCGLSKRNQISPNAVAHVLQHEFYGKFRSTYQDSLSVAGVDGTLEDRFHDSDLRKRVFGKSGYVVGVRSLSGYLHARDGQWYAFSILMNSLAGGDAQAKLIQERIVQAVDNASGSRITSSN